MVARFGKHVFVCGLLASFLVCMGSGALQGRPRNTAIDPATQLLRSPRMVYRDGRRFLITLWRATNFPALLGGFGKVECRFVTSNGTVALWSNDEACYMLNGSQQDATFGFKAQGHGSGQLVITIDDDVIGPIPIDETPYDPCAVPGPVGTKPLSSPRK